MDTNSLWSQYLQEREKIKIKNDLWDVEHKCHICDTIMKKTTFEIAGYNNIRGWECPKCGEGIIHNVDSHFHLLINKLRHGKEIKLGELGGALIVRIPKEVVDLYHLKKGDNVTVKVRDANRIELEV